jgi:hypothetical protein
LAKQTRQKNLFRQHRPVAVHVPLARVAFEELPEPPH